MDFQPAMLVDPGGSHSTDFLKLLLVVGGRLGNFCTHKSWMFFFFLLIDEVYFFDCPEFA